MENNIRTQSRHRGKNHDSLEMTFVISVVTYLKKSQRQPNIRETEEQELN